MNRTELLQKTAFCCMACDGDIDPTEVELIKAMPEFSGVDVGELLTRWVADLARDGKAFLKAYLAELSEARLTQDEECQLAQVAIQTIEADNEIRYNEIAFFKKIRRLLKAEDDVLLQAISVSPSLSDQITPEDYLLPDISDEDDFSAWDNTFVELNLPSPEADS